MVKLRNTQNTRWCKNGKGSPILTQALGPEFGLQAISQAGDLSGIHTVHFPAKI